MCPQETHPQLFQLFYCFCAENRSAELESKMATRFYTFSKSVVVCLCQNPLHATLHATLRNKLHTYTLHYTLHYPICFSLHYTLYAMLHATLCNVLITLHSTILHFFILRYTLHPTLLYMLHQIGVGLRCPYHVPNHSRDMVHFFRTLTVSEIIIVPAAQLIEELWNI